MDAQTFDKVYWHEAFYEALRLELHQYLDSLTFLEEHPLSKEALIVDVIVIKKKQGATIKKNIGETFRGHNLFEFKSENDSLTVRDYNKVMGYAYLYASFTPADLSDMTVSFVVTVHPRDLLSYLNNERQFEIVNNGSGINRIEGEAFPVQILESKKLPKSENLFLKILRSNLDIDDVKEAADAYEKHKPFNRKNVLWDRVIQANYQVFREAVVMGEVAKGLFFEVGEEQGWFVERELNKAREIARGLKKNNVPMKIIEESTGLTAQEIEEL